MILLISNIANEAASAWVHSFPAGAGSLITAADFYLSFKAGIFVNEFSSSSLIINDNKINPGDISGVITTVAYFSPIEFYYINSVDRDYVCMEVNSFINFFLSELKCKKINAPTRRSFSGPRLQKLEWAQLANQLNIPVLPFTMKNGIVQYDETEEKFETLTCTLINNMIMESDVNEKICQSVRLLANQFSLPYLRCYFSIAGNKDFYLSGVSCVPDIADPLHREAIINYF